MKILFHQETVLELPKVEKEMSFKVIISNLIFSKKKKGYSLRDNSQNILSFFNFNLLIFLLLFRCGNYVDLTLVA